MTTEDEYVLKTTVKDEQLAALNRKLESTQDDLRAAVSAVGTFDVATLKADASVQRYAASVASLNKEIKDVKAASGTSSQALLNMGRLMDDIQYVPTQGLRPIINNVMELSPAIGMAMIAVQALWTNWKPLMESMGMGTVKTQAQEMEELAKSTEKTAAETAKLLKYQEQQSTMQAQQSSKTRAQHGQAKAVNDAIAEAQQDQVVRGVVQAGRDVLDADKEVTRLTGEIDKASRLARAFYEASEFGSDEEIEGKIRNDPTVLDLESKRDTQLDKVARQLMADAANDPRKLDLLRGIVKDNPGAFPPGFGEKLAGATPAAMKKLAADVQKRDFAEEAHESFREAKAEEMHREAEKAGFGVDAAESFREAKRAEASEDARKRDYGDEAASSFAEAKAEELRRDEHKRAQSRKEVGNTVSDARQMGVGDLIKAQFEAAMKNGGDVEGLAQQMHGAMWKRFGMGAGSELVNDARAGAMKSAMADAMKGPEIAHSQKIGAAAYADAIQAGVSNANNPAIKALEEARRASGLLAQILAEAKKPKPNPPILFK